MNDLPSYLCAPSPSVPNQRFPAWSSNMAKTTFGLKRDVGFSTATLGRGNGTKNSPSKRQTPPCVPTQMVPDLSSIMLQTLLSLRPFATV